MMAKELHKWICGITSSSSVERNTGVVETNRGAGGFGSASTGK